jgi:hypothetical protein
MSYDSLLIHDVEVRRRNGQSDRFGQPVEPSPDRFADAVYRGRLGARSGGEQFPERSHDVVVETAKVYLQLGAELSESDRVTVRDPRTGRVLAQNCDVTEVTVAEDSQGPHHIEAKISLTRSGTDGQIA